MTDQQTIDDTGRSIDQASSRCSLPLLRRPQRDGRRGRCPRGDRRRFLSCARTTRRPAGAAAPTAPRYVEEDRWRSRRRLRRPRRRNGRLSDRRTSVRKWSIPTARRSCGFPPSATWTPSPGWSAPSAPATPPTWVRLADRLGRRRATAAQRHHRRRRRLRLGASTVIMAQAYSRSTFVGSDYRADSIDLARTRAADAGVTDRVRFELAPFAWFGGGPYDLVTTFKPPA